MRKPPWAPCPPNNPHCQGQEEPASAPVSSEFMYDCFMGFAILFGIFIIYKRIFKK